MADRILATLHRRLVVVLAMVAAAANAYIYLGRISAGPLRDDAQGYYLYLPAVWLYHDLGLTDPRLAHPPWAFHHFAATGLNGDIYEFGVALLCSPLFLLGHLVAALSGQPAEGYSTPEQLGAVATALVMFALGAWALRRSLARLHSPAVAVAAIACVVFGTGVFDYAVLDSLYSHIFAFGLVCLLLPAAEWWAEAPGSWRRAAAVGVLGGLLALVRLNDALFALLPPAYLLLSRGRRPPATFAVYGAVALAVWLPQLLLYRYQAGYWTTNLYLGLHFDWLSPHLAEALFSFRPHGWLPYSPVVLFALPGLVVMARRRQPWAWPLVVALLVNLYVVASWQDWSYGSGFGLRPMVDSAGLLALPLAAFFSELRTPAERLATLLVAWAMVLATAVLTVDYWHGLLPLDGIDAPGYLRLLLRL